MEEPTQNKLHELFRLGLLAKGCVALFEVVGGILVYFVSPERVLDVVTAVTQNELTIDPTDFLANLLVNTATDFSVASQMFVAIYLLLHGAIKLVLIWGLWREKLVYYPASLVVFTLFIVYQLYRYTHTESIWLLVISVLDLVVLALIFHEYRGLKRHAHPE